jgi:hypothetical protein
MNLKLTTIDKKFVIRFVGFKSIANKTKNLFL